MGLTRKYKRRWVLVCVACTKCRAFKRRVVIRQILGRLELYRMFLDVLTDLFEIYVK